MGGKSGPQLPPAPDPAATSAAQAASNMGTARVSAALNRVNSSNPYYSTSWTKGYQQQPAGGGGAGQPTDGSGGNNKPPAQQQSQQPSGQTQDSGAGVTSGEPGHQGQQGQHGSFDHYDQYGNPVDSYGAVVLGDQYAGNSGSGSGDAAADPNDKTANPDVSGDQWTQTTTLSPEQQQILRQQQQLQTQSQGVALGQLPKVQNALGQTVTYDGLPKNVTGVDYNSLQKVDPNFQRGQIQSSLDFSGLPQLDPGTGIVRNVNPQGQWDYNDVGGPQRTLNVSDPTSLMTGAAQTFYGASTALTQPQIQQQHEQLRQSLADRGIPEDSEAGMRELRNFQTSADITNQQAASDALKNAQGFAPTLFGMDLSKFGAENSAQNQAFTQTAQQRGDLLGQGLSLADFTNKAQQQGFGQNLATDQQLQGQITAQGQFANQAQNQDFSQQAQQQQLAAALRAQGLSEQEVNAQLAAQARSAGYTEQQNVRMQPINDTVALLKASGG